MPQSHDNAAPRFTTVVRGYDRLQVDDYLEHLSRWIEQAEYRAQQGEAAAARASAETEQLRRRVASMDAGPPRSATPQSMKALGNRVEAIMQSSFQAAKELNTRAEDAARAASAAAEEKATRIIADATARAEELSQAAEELFVQAQQALAGAGGAVAEQVDQAKARAAAEREKILEAARNEARDVARRAAAEERARREQLSALEEQRGPRPPRDRALAPAAGEHRRGHVGAATATAAGGGHAGAGARARSSPRACARLRAGGRAP